MIGCWIYLFLVFLLLGWVVDKLPFIAIARTIMKNSKESIAVMQSNNHTDEEKQRMLLGFSLSIMRETLKIAGLLTIVSLMIVGLFFIYPFLKIDSINLFNYTLTWQGILLSILSFCCYFLMKKIYATFRL